MVISTARPHFTPGKDPVEQKRNVMAHAQKPDLVFQRNGRVHLYRRGCQFSRMLAAEVCASAVVMLDRPCPIQCTTAGYPLPSSFPPSLLHPCVSVCHHIPFLLYPFYRRLGGPQSRSGRAENFVPAGIRSRTVQPVVTRYTD